MLTGWLPYSCQRLFNNLVSFVFQAEDGIRDLVRSRGLGDVYKRQASAKSQVEFLENSTQISFAEKLKAQNLFPLTVKPVSYTHLTLPTSDLV